MADIVITITEPTGTEDIDVHVIQSSGNITIRGTYKGLVGVLRDSDLTAGQKAFAQQLITGVIGKLKTQWGF